MDFQYNYNLSGTTRKSLVAAISQALGQPLVYQGAPSFSYTIGGYTVDRDGMLSCGSDADPEAVKTLMEALREQGFVPEPETSTDATDAETPSTFTVEVPDTGFTPEARENLKRIVASKEGLFRQALGADSLPIVETEGRIAFPWFTLHGLEGEADAYNRLVTAICNMAKNQKRVTAIEKPIENAKYAMRLFLVRLGFVGDEYKIARKILLKNLTGNSSWKSGHKPERPAENVADDEPAGTTVSATAPVDESLEESTENKGGDDYAKE